jgi:hypothetical protein
MRMSRICSLNRQVDVTWRKVTRRLRLVGRAVYFRLVGFDLTVSSRLHTEPCFDS